MCTTPGHSGSIYPHETRKSRIDRNERVAILFPQARFVFRYARRLAEAGLEVEVNRSPSKKATDLPVIDFGTQLPILMAYPSSKGLTFDTVLMHRLNRKLVKQVDRGVQRGHFGAQRFLRHVLAVFGCLTNGVCQHIGLTSLDTGVGQLTGNG